MLRRYHCPRRLLLASLVVATALLAGCSSSGAGTKAGATATSAPGSGSTAAAGTASSSGSGAVPLPAKVRVIDLTTGSDGSGQAIDVWAGAGPGSSTSTKLATVDYAKRSDVLTPLAGKYDQPQEKNGVKVYGYQLWIVPKGATTTDGGVYQNEDAYPGDELTILVTSLAGSTSSRGLGTTVYFTKYSTERDSLRTVFQGITTPSGKRLVALDAHGVVPPSADATNAAGPTFDLASGGACTGEAGPSDRPPVSSPNTRVTISTGSVADFAYLVPDHAASVDVVAVPTGVTTAPPCSHKVATIDLGAAPSGPLMVFLYGDPANTKSLTFPG